MGAGVAALALLAVGAWVVSVNVRAGRATRPAEPDIGEVLELPGGDIQVRLDGDPDAPPIVLLHGFAGSMLWWQDAAELLARDFRVIRIDLLGHGGSEMHAGDYSTVALARQVGRALDELGVSRALVVGQSMGGLVAILLADIRPGLVEKLVVVDSPLEYRYQQLNLPGKLIFLPVVGPLMRALATDSTLEKALSVVFAPGFPVPPRLVQDSRRMTWRAFKQSDDGQDRFLQGVPTPAERVAALGIPIRVIWGGQDVLWPIGAADGYRGLPDVGLVEVSQAGHSPMVEAPAETARLIAEFAAARGSDATPAMTGETS